MPNKDSIESMALRAKRRREAPQGVAVDSKTIDHPGDPSPATCLKCEQSIIVHCDQCQIQISGCGCTMKALIDSSLEEARNRRLGLWTPDGER